MGIMRHLDLFSGIGGFALAAKWVGWETVGFCEIDPYCQKVLKKHWPDVPIYDDIRELKGEEVGSVGIISGGYPCQPFSVAGKQRGEEDDRHLWPEFARLISEIKPRYAVCENVAGHINMGLDAVLSDLEGLGYATEQFVIPACAVDAKHRRDRVWVIANARHDDRATVQVTRNHDEAVRNGKEGSDKPIEPERPGGGIGGGEVLADTGGGRQPGQGQPVNTSNQAESGEGQATESLDGGVGQKWATEPNVGRVAYGIPDRMDRLKGLGNAIVPQVAEVIFRAIDND